jgi:hypothetical protein
VQGQKKIRLQDTDDVLVVGLHMVGKRVEVSSLNNVTSFLALDSSIFISFLLFLFLFSFSINTYIFFFTFLSLYILSLSLKLSTHLFLA